MISPASRGIFMISKSTWRRIISIVVPQNTENDRKRKSRGPISSLVPVCPYIYLDPRNIVSNPTALPNEGRSYVQLFGMHVGSVLGQHKAQEMKIVS